MDINGSIIVYRNPLEQMLWEGGYLFPIMVSCFVGLVVFITMYQISSHLLPRFLVRFRRLHQYNTYATYIGGFFGVWAGLSLMLYMI